MTPGQTGPLVERTSRTTSGAVAELVRSTDRGDRHRIVVDGVLRWRSR